MTLIDVRLPALVLARVKRCATEPRLLADRHYSRQTPGARDFLPPGRTLVLYRLGVVWGVVENYAPRRAGRRWRVTIYRNEQDVWRSSEIVRVATHETYCYWKTHYGGLPAVPLRTEVDPRRVRSTNPGYCFLVAGWTHVEWRRGLRVLQAPAPEAA